ncbi:uncharacterized protein LOC119075357 [Bradysia coprophila]|uniref:uncharacterized protein LOC119075357 n=1 Tax=Bradysia coprophila TaxID=38358 RepID=UPI00187DC5F9|nr:uncharacterized protein LOC119075357 [Bradysia coprophila]
MANPKPNIAVQKQLVRGTQKTNRLATVKTHTSPSLYQQNNPIRTVTAAASTKDKYRKPQLQATMGLAQQIDQWKAKTGPKYNDVCDLTPRSRAVVTERITHQLNFPTEATVFKKLIPVNVNDSVLEEICPKVKKRRPFTRHKDPEPVLGDYLTPVVPLELKIEQSDSTIELKQPDSFDYSRMYSLFKVLNAGL